MPDDELILDHTYEDDGVRTLCAARHLTVNGFEFCNRPSREHANPGPEANRTHLINTVLHLFEDDGTGHCSFTVNDTDLYPGVGNDLRRCGYPEAEHAGFTRRHLPVRVADVAQYARAPMPEDARKGITVTLIDAPTDPLGTLAVLCGMYEGKVRRAKSEVTDAERREAYEAMMATVLSGPLEAVQFTFLIEGVSRGITHQMVRNRFSFFAQESLRFAVAEDWAQEVPLPPALACLKDDDPRVRIWLKSLNAAEDSYAALVAAGLPAEEARGVLPHAITTRLYWTVSLRTLIMEAGKRTCTQAQFDWRVLFGGVAKALRERAGELRVNVYVPADAEVWPSDGWQYELFADAIRPVCYQTGSCGFMAKFDRGCTIRSRVDAFAREGIGSEHWGRMQKDMPQDPEDGGEPRPWRIDPAEWAADPSAARVTGE